MTRFSGVWIRAFQRVVDVQRNAAHSESGQLDRTSSKRLTDAQAKLAQADDLRRELAAARVQIEALVGQVAEMDLERQRLERELRRARGVIGILEAMS
jgi:hypothetical protein